jgi:sporulation protein YlmC with PRC-barrel domain
VNLKRLSEEEMLAMFKALLTPAAVVMTLCGPAVAQTAPGAPGQAPGASPQAGAPAALTFLSIQKQSEKAASEMIGVAVLDRNGESIGKISDLIMDQDQKTVGAVLLIGGVMGIGGKLVGVPWQTVSFQTKDGKPTASVAFSRDALETAPEFKTQAQLKAEEEKQRARATQQQSPGQSPRPTAPMPR